MTVIQKEKRVITHLFFLLLLIEFYSQHYIPQQTHMPLGGLIVERGQTPITRQNKKL